METRFPTAQGYSALFLAGYRKTMDARTEHTGVVVLKRTYAIDPDKGTVMPAPSPLPVFNADQPENLALNGGFEEVDNALRYEHDMAAFKPEGDLIILGYSEVSGLCRVFIDGELWLQETFTPTDVANGLARRKALFGWQARANEPRKSEAGTFPTDAQAYPLADPLPEDFQNRFYNGYQRAAAQSTAPFPYLPATARIQIERNVVAGTPADLYQFALRGDMATATYAYYSGTGLDDANHWQTRTVAMNLDTLVIEPDMNRCYVVWRGAWPLNRHTLDAYRRLTVLASD
jgi:hypothetical protein